MRRNTPRTGRRAGLTMIELMAAVAIVAILALLIVPGIRGVRDRARLAETVSDVRSLQRMVIVHWKTYGTLPETDELGVILHKDGDVPVADLYEVIPLFDADKGHGNDLDGVDDDNPGRANRDESEALGEICVVRSKKELALASYVYSVDYKRVQVAEPGTDPLGIIPGNNGNGNGGGNHGGNNGNGH